MIAVTGMFMACCASIQVICSVNGRALFGIQIRNCNGKARWIPIQTVVPAQDEFFFREIGVAASSRRVHKIIDIRIALCILIVSNQDNIVPVVLGSCRVIAVISPGLNRTDDGRAIVKIRPELRQQAIVELQYILEKEAKKRMRFENQSDIVELRHKTNRKGTQIS